jgi:hypothetical protein
MNVTLTNDQIHLANDLYLFAITTPELYPAQCDIRDSSGNKSGMWLGHATKALGLYETQIGVVAGMRHGFVIMKAASLIRDHYKP